MNMLDNFDAAAARNPAKPAANNGNLLGSFDAASAQANAQQAAQQRAANLQQGLQKYNPTEGNSFLENAAIGGGKGAVDIGSGLYQLGAEGLNAISPSLVSDQTVSNIRQQADQRKALDNPVMHTAGGVVGDIGANVAATVIPLGIAARGAQAVNAMRTANVLRAAMNPGTYRAAAAVGAGLGFAQPVGTNDSRLANTAYGALGGAGGRAIGGAIGTVAQPVTNALGAAGQRAVTTLRNAGVPLDAAQQTGNALLNRIRSSLSDNPFTAGGQAALRDTQQTAFNRAALNTIGADADAATPDVMGAARTRIGGVFNDVANRNPINYDNQLDTALTDLRQQAATELNPQQMHVIQNQLDNITNQSSTNMTMTGRAYQNQKQILDRLSGGNDPSVGFYARGIRDAMDDALERSVQNPEDLTALQTARQQWGNMRKLEGSIDTEGAGNISASKLANVLGQKANRNTSVYGNGNQDLVNLAQAGKYLLNDKLANSGTTSRAVMQMLMQGGVGGAAGYFGSGGDPVKAAEFAGGAIATPRLLQYMLNNPTSANYLANGIGNGTARTLLQSPVENPVLSNVLRQTPMQATTPPNTLMQYFRPSDPNQQQ